MSRLGTLRLLVALGIAAASVGSTLANDERPNILWLTSEDNGPHLGCYGDDFADTPHLDRLARQGTVYLNAWSDAPVCAPARTAIISGIYPPSTGAQHMRSMTRLPAGFHMYPRYLRDAGYYCINNSKEDYNLEKVGQVWDESNRRAHFRNRKSGQPFFAIFNSVVSHESRIRSRPHDAVHDPAKVRVPAYHPDTPEVRQDWAQYYDKVTEMDAELGARLQELEEDGLAENTIVFYYGDHGSGMPRSKRWPYNSGLHIPLIVYIPEKFQHLASEDYAVGGESDRLVGFVDLAPTLLSLIGIEPPEHMQGRAFLGKHQAAPRSHLFGFRGRMDERYDMVRSVRDKRYIYIRNFMPHKIYGQYLSYMFQTPTTQVWKRLYDQGELNEAQSAFWKTKPAEELYDLHVDPDEINNLADDPAYAEKKAELSNALHQQIVDIRDLGFLPEHEIHARAGDGSPHEYGHSDAYPIETLLTTALAASSLTKDDLPTLERALGHEDGAVRYWAVLGLQMRGADAVMAHRRRLRNAITDDAPNVRIAAAEALALYGAPDDLPPSLRTLYSLANAEQDGVYLAMHSLNAISTLGEKAEPLQDALKKLPRQDPTVDRRLQSYVDRLLTSLLEEE